MGLDPEDTNDVEAASRDENAKSLPLTLNPIADVPTDLQSVGLIELLEIDERPILILDLTSPTKAAPVYINPRLRELRRQGISLGTIVGSETLGASRNHEYPEFWAWATSALAGRALPVTTYYGMEWTGQTLRARWRVISGFSLSRMTEE